jgi:VWFA-related protein
MNDGSRRFLLRSLRMPENCSDASPTVQSGAPPALPSRDCQGAVTARPTCRVPLLHSGAGPERPSSGPESAGYPAATGSVAPFLESRGSESCSWLSRSSHSCSPAACLILVAAMIAAAQPRTLQLMPQEAPPAAFHAGTRLVEVEVVVRDHRIRPPGASEWLKWFLDSGPPFGPPGDPLPGLTKDDFTLLDQGKPQELAVFRAGPSKDAKPMVLPPGTVSNRQDSQGQPLGGATAVLIDFLNTDFGCLGYERLGMNNLLRSLTRTDGKIALYTLGENLHFLHDFTDDPQKLVDAAASLAQPHGKLPPDFASAIHDYGDLLDLGREQVHGQMTTKALKLIIQHLSGVPGRKSLVWLLHQPGRVPPVVMGMAQRANIVLYPVLVRATNGELCPGVAPSAAEELAAVTGARAFFDSLDLNFALRTVAQDASTHYVLGYYPAEETLDGKYHTITVKLFNKAPDKQPLEVHYRPGYLATKAAVPAPTPTPQELFEGPGNSAAIGLTAQATPDAQHPGWYDLRVTVDLHDIHLEHSDGHFTGRFDFSFPNPSIKGTVKTGTVEVDLLEQQLAEALESGFILNLKGVEPASGEIRVVVRDRWTDIAGSLRIPVVNQ